MATLMFSFSFAFAFIDPLIPRIFNVVVFFGILFFLLRKPVKDFFADRFQRIRSALTRAAKEKEDAEASIKAIDARLAQLDSEIARIHADAKAEAAAEQERLEAQTQAEIAKIKEIATREIDAARQNALIELRQFTAASAVTLAEQLIRRELTPQDDAALLQRASQGMKM